MAPSSRARKRVWKTAGSQNGQLRPLRHAATRLQMLGKVGIALLAGPKATTRDPSAERRRWPVEEHRVARAMQEQVVGKAFSASTFFLVPHFGSKVSSHLLGNMLFLLRS